jgi:hypothetical protein
MIAIGALYASLSTPLPVGSAGAADHERWVPALGLNFGLEMQDVEADSSTSDILGPPVDPSIPGIVINNPIRPPSSGDSFFSMPSLSGTLEIMTPSFFDDWGRPRLFARVGVGANMAAKLKPSSERAVKSPMTEPPDLNFWFEDEIIGQGSKTEIYVDELEITASLGIAFETTFDDRTVRIRPSAEFVRREVTGRGAVNRAIQVVARPFGRLRDITDTRLEYFRVEEDQDLYGIGPGLEFEIDATRAGPIVMTVYAGGAVYYYPGDTEWDGSATNQYDEFADFNFEVDEWSYRGNAGVRLRWSPD